MNNLLNIDIFENNKIIIKSTSDNLKIFINSPTFKFKLEHFVDLLSNNEILINFSLDNFERILNTIKECCQKDNLEARISNSCIEYVNNRNKIITKRIDTGTSLKQIVNNSKLDYLYYKNEVNSILNRPLREKQMIDSFFMYKVQKAMNFSVPGSGKTASVIGVFSFLIKNNLINKLVIIGPKNCFTSWINELNICLENKISLSYFESTKQISKQQKIFNLKYQNNNVLIFNYESVSIYLDILKEKIDEKTLLVFDESHKIKRINGKFANVCLEISKKPKYTIMLTGTPIPNGYIDIFNMLNILFQNEYSDFFKFNIKDLKEPNESTKKKVNDSIYPFFCRTTKDELNVPKPNEDIFYENDASELENKILKVLFEKYKQSKLALFIRILQLESNPKMLLNEIDNDLINDIFEDEWNDQEIFDDKMFNDKNNELVELVGNGFVTTKTKHIIEIIKELISKGKSIIVWCIFIDSINNLKTILDSLLISSEIICGYTNTDQRKEVIENFKNKKFTVLITNPHTLAESVSLHTVCHDAIYFEYSYNLVHLLQSKDRIHRLGLKEDDKIQWYFMKINYELENGYYSIDQEIYNRLKYKEDEMIKAIDNNVLEENTDYYVDLNQILDKLYKNNLNNNK